MENKFYYEKSNTNGSAEKLITVKNGEVVVQPMWRAQLIAKQLFNVDTREYEDNTNWELLDEMLWQTDNKEEREEVYNQYYQPDSLDIYFERVAECMEEIGAYKMALKCKVKSLLLKYNNLTNQYDIPLDNLKIIYHELIEFGYERAATRLNNYHLEVVARVVSNS